MARRRRRHARHQDPARHRRPRRPRRRRTRRARRLPHQRRRGRAPGPAPLPAGARDVRDAPGHPPRAGCGRGVERAVLGRARHRVWPRVAATTSTTTSPRPSEPARSSPTRRPTVMRRKRAKLLLNLVNVLDAACGPDPGLGPIAGGAQEEGVAAVRGRRPRLVDADEEDAARRGDHIRMRRIDGKRRGGGSTWQSLARGCGRHRGRLPQRRDRPARPPPRRADAGERRPPAPRPAPGVDGCGARARWRSTTSSPGWADRAAQSMTTPVEVLGRRRELRVHRLERLDEDPQHGPVAVPLAGRRG